MGFAKSPKANAPVKLHVQEDYGPSRGRPFVLRAKKFNDGMKQWKSAQKLLLRMIPLVELTNKEAPQLLLYQSLCQIFGCK